MNPHHILVVEDEKALQKIIRFKLESDNFKVSIANEINKAFEVLSNSEQKVDLIWLDHYLLGKKNGLDLVREINKHKKWNKLPIFVVSNTATPVKVSEYKQLGISKYYQKAEHSLSEIINDIKEKIAK